MIGKRLHRLMTSFNRNKSTKEASTEYRVVEHKESALNRANIKTHDETTKQQTYKNSTK